MSKNIMAVEYAAITGASLVGAATVPINVGGFTEPCSILRIVNDSANILTLLMDKDGSGAVTFDRLLANSVFQMSFQTNAGPKGYVALMPKGTVIYAASVTANAGIITVSNYYQPND